MYISVCSGKAMTKMGVNGSSEITAACNKDCKCSTYFSQPVCGSNNVAYFDPCHAGCMVRVSDDVSRKIFQSLRKCSLLQNAMYNTMLHGEVLCDTSTITHRLTGIVSQLNH
jgi:hypothetical protein